MGVGGNESTNYIPAHLTVVRYRAEKWSGCSAKKQWTDRLAAETRSAVNAAPKTMASE